MIIGDLDATIRGLPLAASLGLVPSLGLVIIHLYHFCLVPGGQELTCLELAPKGIRWF